MFGEAIVHRLGLVPGRWLQKGKTADLCSSGGREDAWRLRPAHTGVPFP